MLWMVRLRACFGGAGVFCELDLHGEVLERGAIFRLPLYKVSVLCYNEMNKPKGGLYLCYRIRYF